MFGYFYPGQPYLADGPGAAALATAHALLSQEAIEALYASGKPLLSQEAIEVLYLYQQHVNAALSQLAVEALYEVPSGVSTNLTQLAVEVLGPWVIPVGGVKFRVRIV